MCLAFTSIKVQIVRRGREEGEKGGEKEKRGGRKQKEDSGRREEREGLEGGE